MTQIPPEIEARIRTELSHMEGMLPRITAGNHALRIPIKDWEILFDTHTELYTSILAIRRLLDYLK